MRKHVPIVLLLVFIAIIYLSISFEPSVIDNADGTHAQAAREMLQRNDWITMHVNGVRYLQKAPLLYWLVASAYQVFGFNAFAVRFPTVVAIVLLGWMTYTFGKWAYSRKVGLYAAASLIFCCGMFLFTRFMIPEALLTLLFTTAHFCFLKAFFGTGKSKRFYYGFYIAIALAVLTKGLIGIVLTVSPIFLFLLLTGNLAAWRELRLFSGSILFLVIAVPWHILVGIRNEHFFWYYFVNEHFLRFLGQRYPKDYGKLPPLNYWLLHLVWLFPWSLGFPLLITQRPRWKALANKKMQVNLYLWLWAGVILVFFSISSGLEYYTFPAYPALALLLSLALTEAEEGIKTRKYLIWMNGILAIFGIAFATIMAILLWKVRNVQATGDISSFLNIASSDDKRYTIALGHLFDFTPYVLAELRDPAIGSAFILGLGFLLAFWFRHNKQHIHTVTVMVMTMGLLFICANQAYIKFEPVLSSRILAEEIKQRWEPNAKIVLNGNYETGSSLRFYVNQPIYLLNGRTLTMEFGSRYPDTPAIFLNDEDIRRLWRSSDRIFLFTENPKKETLLKNLALPTFFVVEKGGKSVFTNRPLL
ncbi:glycosyltransferase family 39 protein [Scytonema sp. UIC 10036]|uniref:ArnT family glycosyltransferase n=1 Tax=Scytonema sp. UIC 10036 TaxID=2304196 RepID=UPI0012DA971F|nr:glycosyltransferase family 39 protein [Scytonema sp. UIC 10036]MUG91449.1 glycosyltransferase family 39 protein [Scytonema sp. UIC 10036]